MNTWKTICRNDSHSHLDSDPDTCVKNFASSQIEMVEKWLQNIIFKGLGIVYGEDYSIQQDQGRKNFTQFLYHAYTHARIETVIRDHYWLPRKLSFGKRLTGMPFTNTVATNFGTVSLNDFRSKTPSPLQEICTAAVLCYAARKSSRTSRAISLQLLTVNCK
uniref:Uncharacterized protein n=1 Tax=Daphnia galeata TaxID=27404 RepID=A0A8J2RE09_9CRUS|nr:unnamed protein product [Daphnia galeata]